MMNKQFLWYSPCLFFLFIIVLAKCFFFLNFLLYQKKTGKWLLQWKAPFWQSFPIHLLFYGGGASWRLPFGRGILNLLSYHRQPLFLLYPNLVLIFVRGCLDPLFAFRVNPPIFRFIRSLLGASPLDTEWEGYRVFTKALYNFQFTNFISSNGFFF